MTDSARLSVIDELAQLRAEVRQLRAEVATQTLPAGRAAVGRRGRSWQPRVAAVAAVALAGVAFMGIATASTPGHPADVTYIALSVPHKILSNASIGKAVTTSVLVIGGATTVPTDATSVQMTVAVKSTAAGSLSVFPADHASSSTASTINFPAGNVVVTQVTKQSPGLNSKVSFTNNGTAAAVVTVTITGYSTQTTASNISGAGGSAGQVLTRTGSGAAWQTPTPGFVLKDLANKPLSTSWTTHVTVTVPAGNYMVTGTASVYGPSASYGSCEVFSPGGDPVDYRYFDTSAGSKYTTISMQGGVHTSGGNMTLQCRLFSGSGDLLFPVLSAIRVGSLTGFYAPS